MILNQLGQNKLLAILEGLKEFVEEKRRKINLHTKLTITHKNGKIP